MNINRIRSISIVAKTQGVKESTGELNELAQAQGNVAQTADAMATVTDKAAKKQLSVEKLYKAQTMRVDELARSQTRLAKEMKIAEDFFRQSDVSASEQAKRMDVLKQRYGAVAPAVDEMAARMSKSSVASQIMVAGMSQMGKQAETATTNVQHLTTQSAALTKQSSRNAAEMLNLGRQFADVAVSVQAGQSLMTVGLQQGAQIIDVFASSTRSVGEIFSQAVGWGKRFATSAFGVASGVAAIGAGALYAASSWQTAQREIERALIGVGKRSGVTVDDINKIASAGATATGLSVDQARTAALEFVKTGEIFKANIKDAVAVTHDFSIVTGKDAKEAAQTLGAALANPVAGAEDLNRTLGFLDGRTREYIISLTNQGRLQEAQAILLKQISVAVQGATATLGPFEKAWDAVANAAIRAKNAIGQALTPSTEAEKLATAIAKLNQLQQSPNFGLFGQSSETQANIKRTKAEVDALTESMREHARATALSGGETAKWSLQADNAVRATIPEIAQIEELEKRLADLRRAQMDPNVKGRMGQSGALNEAATLNQAMLINLQEQRAEKLRIAEIDVNIASHERDKSVSTIKTLIALEGQREVAAAVTGAEQMRAQEVARTVELYMTGKSLIEASAIASAERAVSEAKVNAAVEEQTHQLEQQTQLIKARQNGTEATVKAEQAYENAIRAGADAATASSLQAAVLANERAKANEKAAQQLAREVEEMARLNAEVSAYLAKMAFVPFAFTGKSSQFAYSSKQLFETGAGFSQFNPAGYQSSTSGIGGVAVPELAGLNMPGLGAGQSFIANIPAMLNEAARIRMQQNPFGYLEGGVDEMLRSGGTVSSQIDRLLRGISATSSQEFMAANTQMLSRLTELLPDDQKIGALERQLDVMRQQPGTLANQELVRQLTDQLEQLRKATEDNTDAINAQADPLFSQGHEFINSLKIGYYKAAHGLSATVTGMGGQDSVPIHMMLTPGEHLQVTPPSMSPSSVANDNSRNVTQHITINIEGGNTPTDRLTARQRAQGFIKAATMAAS